MLCESDLSTQNAKNDFCNPIVGQLVHLFSWIKYEVSRFSRTLVFCQQARLALFKHKTRNWSVASSVFGQLNLQVVITVKISFLIS
jgi:hypothetical protein